MKLTWTFSINGTAENPFHRFGLRQNPFPQHGQAELDAADLALQSLGGDPVTGPDDIRARLRGIFVDEFIESIVARYVPGENVNCEVTCEWKERQR